MRAQLLDNQTVGLFFDYNAEIVSLVKRLPGRVFEPKLKVWLLPVDGLLAVNLEKLSTAGFDVSDARRGLIPAGTNTLVLEPPIASFGAGNLKLRPYQAEKASLAIMRRGGLIRGFCGCGKTAIALAVAHNLNCARTLIVCPKSVLVNWQREIRMWLDLPATIVAGTPGQRKKMHDYPLQHKYTIVTYDTLRIDLPYFAGQVWDAVIFDEAHYLVNTSSGRSKAARAVRARHKFGLTATPIMNSALDIYGVMKALDRDLGNYKLFVDRYCEKDMWGSVKYFKHMEELRNRIAPWIIPIDLAEAEPQLPPRTDTDLEFELSAAEASLYSRIKKELLFELEKAEVSKLSSPMVLQNTLTKLGKLQELTDSCELIGESTKSTKLEILKEHLENNLYDQKAIIFTRFERMARILALGLSKYSPVVLTGTTQDRQSVIDQFTNNSNQRIFISTEAGGAGINLQAANIVYNYDLPFSLGKLEQRNGRIRWHQQDRPVFFYNLMALLPGGKKTIDHFVKDKIIKKQAISDKLLLSDVKEILSV